MKLQDMKVKELRSLAGELNIPGRWEMNKGQLISAIERAQTIKEAEELGIKVNYIESVEELKKRIEEKKNESSNKDQEEERVQPRKKGRIRTIEVYKDGQLVKTIEGLIETFKWAADNQIANQGWVKHSLKTGKETVAGRKFKQGGYLFKYAD